MQVASFAARWARHLGVTALVLIALGPLLNQLKVTPPMGGFTLFLVGVLLGVVTLGFAIVGVARTRPSSGRSGRPQALTGLGCGGAAVALLLLAGSGGSDLPPINDITTDPATPPAFVAILEIQPDSQRDMGYPDLGDPPPPPDEAFAPQQLAAYPDLAPIELAMPPAQALAEVRAAALDLGWDVIATDPASGRLEATDSTAIFRFVDDVVVRVSANGAGVRVDVRSKSRDGRGDLGANAARIRALRDQLAQLSR